MQLQIAQITIYLHLKMSEANWIYVLMETNKLTVLSEIMLQKENMYSLYHIEALMDSYICFLSIFFVT